MFHPHRYDAGGFDGLNKKEITLGVAAFSSHQLPRVISFRVQVPTWLTALTWRRVAY